MTIGTVACYTIIIIFVIWLLYIQIEGWRRTKGFRGTMEMNLVDRYHDEMVYQLCYKRGYKLNLDMNDDNDDAHWGIKKTDHPKKRIVKMIAFWAMIQILFRPYSFRTERIKNFDDFDPKWELEE